MFAPVSGNHVVVATFAINTYSVTASVSGGNGSVAVANAAPNYGDTATVTVTPNTGYHIATITDNGTPIAATSPVVFAPVSGNHVVVATFAINTYTVSATAGAHGSASPATQSVNFGANATITVTPATGYHIASITVDGGPVAASSPVVLTNVTAAHAVAATFAINTFTITPTAGAGGALSPSTVQTANYGDNVSFQVTPNSGYRIGGLTVDGTLIGPASGYTFGNISSSHTISATFVQVFTITPTAGANGSISPGAQTLDAGSQMAFAITPNSGYHIATLLVDSVSVAPTGSVVFDNLSANHTLSATFAINTPSLTTTYTITAAGGANGAVSPPSQSVNSGDNATVTVTPNAGFHIATLLVDGSSVAAVSPVVFSNVTAPHTVSATFAANTFTLAASAGANGAISPSGTQTVNFGDTATFTITPSVGYHIATVLVDGSPVAAASPLVLTNVTANHTIAVTFAVTPKSPSAITIQSDSYSVAFPRPFVLTGLLTPGAYLDPVVVEVQKPNQSPSVPWSYSSNRLCYETVGGSGHWWYRYTPLLRGTYTFRVHYLGDLTRDASVSRTIVVTVH